MKPLFIHMKNIGPFVDEKLDFTQLEEVFLLCGDTGAGKTTIFDAMTFALYGEFLGARKGKAKDFRSQFAKSDDDSFVELEFSSDGEKYRVVRTLPRPYINRNKKADVKASELSVEKFNRESEKYEFINAGKKELDSMLAQIVGLNAPEFSKIVVLPQGEFSEFLRANSNDKQEILKKLFPVDFYQSIVELVKEKNDALQLKINSAQAGLDELLKENDFTGADEKLDSYKNKIDENKKKQNELNKEKDELNAGLAKVTAAMDDAQELENSQAELKKLAENKKSIEELEEKLSLSDDAELIKPFIDVRNQRQKEFDADEARFNEYTEKAKEAELKLNELKDKENENTELGKNIEENKKQLQSLNDKLDAAGKYEAQVKAHAGFEKKLTEAKAGLEKQNEELKNLQKKIRHNAEEAGLSAELESSEITAQIIEKFNKAIEESRAADELYNKVNKFNGLKKNISEAEENVKNFSAEKAECEKQIENNEKLLAEYKAQKEEQAAKNTAVTLVHLLKDGCPCPVCGSIEHPKPVKAAKGFLDLDEKISTAERAVKTETELKSSKAEKIAAENKLLEKLNEEFSELEKICAGLSLEEVTKKSDLLKDEMYRMQDLKEKCLNLAKEIETAKVKVENLKEEKANAESNFNSSLATLKGFEEQIKKNGSQIKSSKELETEIENLNKILAEQEKAFSKFTKDLNNAITDSEASNARKIESENARSAANEKLKESESVLAEKLASSKFKTEKEVLDSFIEKEQKAEFKEEVLNFHNEVSRLETGIEVLSKKVSEKYSVLKEKAENIQNEINSAEEKISDSAKNLEELLAEKNGFEKDYLRYKEKTDELAKLENSGKPLAMLYKDLSGDNPSKVKFETWFLGLFFDDVVVSANRHLLRISGERYEFKMDTEKTGGNSYHGLDLVVHDYQVNQDRDTATLSGGETFMASISLALGLTEVVQKTSSLDSLFIDEGFGSLDKESLEMAVGVLQDIGTTRTVGVISHVEEMLDAIACHVNVRKTRHGSYIEYQ